VSGPLDLARRSGRRLLHVVQRRLLDPARFRLHVAAKHLRYGTDRFGCVEIETGSACNLACSYCPVGAHPRTAGELPSETYHKIILELAELDFAGVLSPHGYNEPLLDDRLVELVRFSRDHLPRCRIVLFTNGTLLTAARLRELLDAGTTKIVVSLHSPATRSIIEGALRGWPAARVRIEYARPAEPGAMLYNRGGLVEAGGMAPFCCCFMPTHYLTIDHRGEVLLCCNDYLGRHSFGSVQARRIVDIWQDERFRSIRRGIREGRFELEICRVCSGQAGGS
jgi:MoaA/NifB/PqqE/SkfB family radical SAM enzyme